MTLDMNSVADPADALKLFEELASANEQSPYDTPAAEPAAQAAPEAKTEAPTEAVEAVMQESEQEAAGVATKDGKHVIPYSVLKSERERATAAERALTEMQTRLAALEAQAKAQPTANTGDSAGTMPEPVAEADMSEAELALLEEDFPTVAKAIRSAIAKAAALEAKLAPMENVVRADVQAREQTRAASVQDAIDAVPKLAHIQASDPDAFAAAKQFDAVLQNSPQWADKPLADRFAKVIEMVESMHGAITIPGQPAPAVAKTPAQLREEAARTVAAAAKPPVPTSLSQFPAGEPVSTDEAAAMESMSHADIAGKLARMTPTQQLHFLSNL